MEGLNQVVLFGNLGADPELRATPAGQSVLALRIATSRTFLDKSNVRQERTEWHRVSVWGKRGEALSKFLRKGDRVLVTGELQTQTYEKNGEKRYATQIVAHGVYLTGKAQGAAPVKHDPQTGEVPPDAEGDPARREAPEDDIPF